MTEGTVWKAADVAALFGITKSTLAGRVRTGLIEPPSGRGERYAARIWTPDQFPRLRKQAADFHKLKEIRREIRDGADERAAASAAQRRNWHKQSADENAA